MMIKGSHRRSLLLLGVIALAIGLGWFGPGKQRAAFSEELLKGGKSDRLKIATYNIHSGKDVNDRLDLEKTIDTLRETGAEIIGLQEVERHSWRTGFVDQAERIAEGLGMDYRFEAGLKIWPFEFGNALLSKYPIRDVERIDLPSTRENRVGLLATLDVQGQDVQVLVTHLGLKQQERADHVQKLVDKLANSDQPFLLIGDFNNTADAQELKPLLKTLRQTANTPLVTFPGEGEQIDHIFVSKQFEVHGVSTLPSTASDHLPLIADLTIKP